jgi:queuosine precursor transporter
MRVIAAWFGALLFASLMSVAIVHLPPADSWRHNQAAIETIFGSTPRIIAASVVAFWCGSFVNSFVLAKMKILTQGRWLWTRTIGSTLCGELVDSSLFLFIAFAGSTPRHELLTALLTQYVMKSSWEIISTPVTYKLVNFLKRAEHEDYYDRDTNFTPFSLRVSDGRASAA